MLTLDGYNNTVALNQSATLNDTDTPLPSWVNSQMLSCVNLTIGAAALLIDDAANSSIRVGIPGTAGIGILWLMVVCLNALF